jgi:hypothetical protein
LEITREPHSNLLLKISKDSTILDFEKKVPNSVSGFEKKNVNLGTEKKKLKTDVEKVELCV